MTDGAPTVTDRLRRVRNDLAPAEERVVQALLADYPMAGLGSVAELAGAAGVSAPTVLRLLAKLGFAGYPQFRETLRRELSARLFSADDVYPAGPHPETGPGQAERLYAETVRDTFRGLDPAELDRAVDALADPGAHVLAAGGRFSATLATHLASYLQTLRAGVEDVPPEFGQRARALLSVDERTVLVVFDYRRYQPDTADFARNVARRSARLVLVCDRFLSPIAPDADVVLGTAVAGPPPFDSLVGGLMVVETLVAAVAERLGDAARERLADFELQANGPESPADQRRDSGIA